LTTWKDWPVSKPRYGMTVPFPGALSEQIPLFKRLQDLGYTDLWSAESNGADGFTPLALAAVAAPELRLGTAIIPAFTRAPAVLAPSVAAMAQAAPGRFAFGIGTSSDVIVERWNGVPFVDPNKRVRDVVAFLREALAGDKVTRSYDTFEVDGFRLSALPPAPVPILVAALRPGMLRLAATAGDGVIINWLSADDVSRVREVTDAVAADPAAFEVVARIFVCPSADRERVLTEAKRVIAAYVNVPVYKAFHEWLGREERLAEHWSLWAAGDRAAAVEAIPDAVVDELIIHGSVDECREHIGRYVANGVTTPVLHVFPLGGVDPVQAAVDLAP
jgi:probable F420-dependent oxidoreductase